MEKSVALFRVSNRKSRATGVIKLKSTFGKISCLCTFCGLEIATAIGMTAEECRAVLESGHGCDTQLAYQSLAARRIAALNGVGRMVGMLGVGAAATVPAIGVLLLALGL